MKQTEKPKKGKLYIVSTHIGNREDITIRAIEILKLCDLVICEDLKIGSKILKELNIHNKLDIMNEQNENEKVFEFIQMINEGNKLALISDCGTPIFADPGNELLRNAIVSNVDIIVVPGASSLMTALVRSGMNLEQFLYAGFPPRNKQERENFLLDISKEKRTVVLYDTPYRLLPVLEDACKIMPHRNIYLGMNLTMPFETHHYGTFQEIYNKLKNERIKAEFVIVFEGMDYNLAIRQPDFFKKENKGKRERRFDNEFRNNRTRKGINKEKGPKENYREQNKNRYKDKKTTHSFKRDKNTKRRS